MTIFQAFKKLQTEAVLCQTPHNAMFDIDFVNNEGMDDETQFTIIGTHTLKDIKKELNKLFSDFCKENGFKANTVVSITYVGPDPEYVVKETLYQNYLIHTQDLKRKKGIQKLARLIKIMAKDVSKESSWWKMEHIGAALGLVETEEFFDEISVTDDSGYRSITIGDTRGNVSRINGRRISSEEHKGYMLLYSENCTYKREKRVWKYKCFPSQKEIEDRLQKVIDKIPLIPMDKNNCDSDEFWYERRDEQALTYLSNVVKKYADTIANDSRTPEEIFEATL